MHVLDMFKLDGRVALVTGGAGRYGSQITVALDPEKIHVFDRETEMAIVN